MRIAFDVKGTIESPMKKQVLHMFKLFQDAGHEVVVWSNSYSYAVNAIKDNNLQNTDPEDKFMKIDVERDESQYFDIAIEDDRRQDYLAAKKFIFVDEIPNAMEDVDKLVAKVLSETQNGTTTETSS